MLKNLILLLVWFSATFTANAFEYCIVTKTPDKSLEGYDFMISDDANRITNIFGKIKDGQVNYCGESDRTFSATLCIMDEENPGNGKRYKIQLIVEPGTITIDYAEPVAVSGGELNTKLIDLKNRFASCSVDEVYRLMLDTFKSNPDNGLGEYALMNYSGGCSPDEWDELFAMLDDDRKEFEEFRVIGERKEKLRKTWEGQPFVDFQGHNVDGSEAKLSDYVGKGKIVVADFWSSWCKGCIIEAKEHLIPLYNEYKDNQDVVFLGVALDNVVEASKKHGIPWAQLMDCDMTPMSLYSFNSIPQIIIFGCDGTILSRNIRGEKVKDKLESILTQ